jgi:hypothetical protein
MHAKDNKWETKMLWIRIDYEIGLFGFNFDTIRKTDVDYLTRYM